jgi:hypothetical protein
MYVTKYNIVKADVCTINGADFNTDKMAVAGRDALQFGRQAY